MAGDSTVLPSLENLSGELLRITGAVDKSVYDKLCARIQTLSRRHFLLHPSMCRCLLQSYALLLRPRLLIKRVSPINVYTSSTSVLCQESQAYLIRELLHALREGEQFLQSCSTPILPWCIDFIAPAPPRRPWLMKKAILSALSTEILDVHLPAFVGCIFALVRMICVGSSAHESLLLQEVKDGLTRIWTSADEKGDVKRMQELLSNIKAKGPGEVCKLIGERLAETRSEAKLKLAGAWGVPSCLWMDSLIIKKTLALLSNPRCEVVKVKSTFGGRFACKHFPGPDFKDEFTNEAAIQASLRHANVMNLLWCTKSAESHCLVMELMDGDLGREIEKRRLALINPPFSLLASIDIMLQIAKGMEHLHGMGIMHRDLKSFNILVRHSQHTDDRDHRLIVKVADYGWSKVKSNTSLFSTKCAGTGIWRAPEVLNHEDETKYINKADVYSFAIVCAEILTGLPPEEVLPCEATSKLHSMLKQGKRPQLPSSCPTAIADYIKKCWDGDASKRPTFKQICTVLHGFKACLLSGEAELLEASLPSKLSKWPVFQAVEDKTGFQGMLHEMDHTIHMAWYLRQGHSDQSPLGRLGKMLLCSNLADFRLL